MKKPFEPEKSRELDKLLGLGDTSIHKSYYPVLQQKIQALEAMEQNLLAIFHRSFDAIIIHDLGGRILDVNDRMLQIFCCRREEALLWRIQDLVGEPVRESELLLLWREQLEGTYREFETVSRRPADNSLFSSIAVLHKIIWNKEPAVMVVVRDTTEKTAQKRALAKALRDLEEMNEKLEEKVQRRTEELADAEKELIRADKLASLGALVAGVAHEINTPIGVSLTAASYLDDAIQAAAPDFIVPEQAQLRRHLDKWQQTAKIILANLHRAAKLIKSFKQVSVDQTSEQVRTFDLRESIGEIIESLLPSIKNTRHKINNQVPHGIVMHSHPGAISQIMTNLIQNALLHAFPPGVVGSVSIQAVEVGDKVEIVVRDDGMGVSPEIQEKIFDPFFTTKRNEGGTGLGLFIIHNLVKSQLQGDIQCHSYPGTGTEFRIQLKKNMAAEANVGSSLREDSFAAALLPGRKIICLEAIGNWTRPDVEQALAEVRGLAGEMAGGAWAFLDNVSRMDANINPETSRAMADFSNELFVLGCQAIAFVVGRGAAIQAKIRRQQQLAGTVGMEIAYLETEEEALEWLQSLGI